MGDCDCGSCDIDCGACDCGDCDCDCGDCDCNCCDCDCDCGDCGSCCNDCACAICCCNYTPSCIDCCTFFCIDTSTTKSSNNRIPTQNNQQELNFTSPIISQPTPSAPLNERRSDAEILELPENQTLHGEPQNSVLPPSYDEAMKDSQKPL